LKLDKLSESWNEKRAGKEAVSHTNSSSGSGTSSKLQTLCDKLKAAKTTESGPSTGDSAANDPESAPDSATATTNAKEDEDVNDEDDSDSIFNDEDPSDSIVAVEDIRNLGASETGPNAGSPAVTTGSESAPNSASKGQN